MKYIKTYNTFNEDATGNASSSAGMGGVSSAGVSGLPGVAGTSGSGDIPFYLTRGKTKRKKGNPSQVSDMRDLEKPKGITYIEK